MTITPHSNIVHAGMQERIVVVRKSADEQVLVRVKDADFKHFKLIPMYNWISENGISTGQVPFKKGALVSIIGFEAGLISCDKVFISIDFVSGEVVETVDFKIIEFMAGIEILEKSLNFGTLKVGQTFDHNVEIKNTGEYEVQILRFNCNIHGSVIFGSFQPILIAPGKSATKKVSVNIMSGMDSSKSALCVDYRVGDIDITSKFKMDIIFSGIDNSSLPFSVSVLPVKVNGQDKTGVIEIESLTGTAIRVPGVEEPNAIRVPIKVVAQTDKSVRVLGATITGGDAISIIKRPDSSPIDVDGFDSTTLNFSFIPNKIEGIGSAKVSFSILYGESKKDVVIDVVWGVSKN